MLELERSYIVTTELKAVGVLKNAKSDLEGLPPLSKDKKITYLGNDVPVRWFEHPEEVTIDAIFALDSADFRTIAIRDFYEGGTIQFYKDLIHRGYEGIVLEPINEDDYQYGRLWEAEFNGVTNKYLEVINRTVEPGSEGVTEQERLDKGWTNDLGCRRASRISQTVAKR